MSTTYSIQTRDGRTITRTSDRAYYFARVRGNGNGASFHESEASARRACRVNRGDYVVPVGSDRPVAPAPAADVWVVTYADGETREVEASVRVSPMMAGRNARPDVPVESASRKR